MSDEEAKLLLTVYDELVLEVRDDAAVDVGDTVKQIMEDAAEPCVSLVVVVGIGDNWLEAH
jgi:DNA polymerase-1